MSDSRLFVVHVLHHLTIGGMENGLVNLINRLPRERFRHAVVCIEDSNDFARRIERDDVEIIVMRRSSIGAWRLRWRLYKTFKTLRPDVVHTRNMSGLDALPPARLLGIFTVHSEHGFDVDNLHGLAGKPALLRRLHSPLVRRFICVSKDLQRLMTQRWAIPSDRVHQIYNGVDTVLFQPPRSRRRELLPDSMRQDGVFVIGTVGRVRPVKDQVTLVRAFARAVDQDSKNKLRLRLAIVGDGPQLAEAQQLAKDLGIGDLCWFAGTRHDIAAVMQAFDLFVLPSLNEGISNTILEAMATGLPLVVTKVGGNVELIREGITGASFAPGDVQRLAELIEIYARDAELCSRQGEAARVDAVQRFSLGKMVEQYQQVYETSPTHGSKMPA